jgi:hypothetical protein
MISSFETYVILKQLALIYFKYNKSFLFLYSKMFVKYLKKYFEGGMKKVIF